MSRVSVRGTLTDVHYEIARTQVAVLNSTLWSYVCAAIDGRNLEDGNSVERIDQASSAGYRRIRNRLTRTGRRRAQGRRPPPDARTRVGALNVSDASPPNTQVTGGVIGNRHLSHRSFCSFPTKRPRACQDAGNKDGTSNRDPSRHSRSVLRISAHYTASDPRPNRVPS